MSTKIEWTDVTWNPVRGCSRVSEGCRNCYAERMAARNLPGLRSPTTGEPFAVLRDAGPRWTGQIELIKAKLHEPLRWKRPRRVFVNSMSDLFHESLPDEAIDRVFAVMALCPQHVFQVLTKRPERMREYFADIPYRQEMVGIVAEYESGIDRYTNTSPRWTFPLDNVWLGVSVEDQVTADERIPLLLQTPAAVRFVSYEPALGPVSFRWASWVPRIKPGALEWHEWHLDGLRGIGWVICGGESGPGARQCDIAWMRSVIAECKEAGVPVFVKQLGANDTRYTELDQGYQGAPVQVWLRDRKGGDPSEWPADLRVREFPREVE